MDSSTLFFLGLDGSGWLQPSPGSFTPRNEPLYITREAGWAPEPVWTSTENLAPTGI